MLVAQVQVMAVAVVAAQVQEDKTQTSLIDREVNLQAQGIMAVTVRHQQPLVVVVVAQALLFGLWRLRTQFYT